MFQCLNNYTHWTEDSLSHLFVQVSVDPTSTKFRTTALVSPLHHVKRL